MNAKFCPHRRSTLPLLASPLNHQPSLHDCIAQLLEAKAKLNRRPFYVRHLGQICRQFAAWCEKRGIRSVDQITRRAIEEWIHESNSPGNTIARLLRVSALCAFSVRRGYLTSNPCDGIERPQVDRGVPAIWTVDQCQRVLRSCRPCDRPFVVLGLFVGLRPTEVSRLDWQDVRLSASPPVVVVTVAASKTRRRRIIPLQPAAIAWLGLDARESGRAIESLNQVRWMHRMAVGAGVPWPSDVLRHTYASMRMAVAGAAEVSREMGNSEHVLLTHYREVVDAQSAAAFWSLTPTEAPRRTPPGAPA